MTGAALELRDLSVAYRVAGRPVGAVHELTLAFPRGQVTAVVGESGSGKSTMARAIARILPTDALPPTGQVLLDGTDLLRCGERELRQIRGARIGFVPQDPMISLNPTQRIGKQVAEAVRLHSPLRGPQLRERVLELLADAGLPDPTRVAGAYPHALSGGMRQRVLIAIAFASEPDLLIADEPTSALDVTVAARVLDQLTTAVADTGTTLVVITHDLALATHRADHVAVLNRGRLVEAGPALQVMRDPAHSYTRELIAATPGLRSRPRRVPVGDDRPARTIVRLQEASKTFPARGRGGTPVRAADGVSLSVQAGRTYALIGESGSGKSTTARMVLGLERADSGSVELFDRDLQTLDRRALRELRRKVQVVYQSPFASLDPRRSVLDSVSEPLRAHGVGDRRTRAARVAELLEQVGLPAAHADRRPGGLSGGQCQRVAIARALALEPELIVCDEPVSALDASVQAQVLDLLTGIQRELGVAYLFISHDLAVVQDIAHDVGVMKDGRLIEQGPADEIFHRPTQAYTGELLAASLQHTTGS